MAQSLKLEILWKDEHLLELKVLVTNGLFSGSTQVYSTGDILSVLAKELDTFTINNRVVNFTGGVDGYNCNITFDYLDKGGRIIVKALLEEEGPDSLNSAALYIITEPALLDNFQRELRVLSVRQEGTAVLADIL